MTIRTWRNALDRTPGERPMLRERAFIITIDGPAGTGKSSVEELARDWGWIFWTRGRCTGRRRR